jgi:hypothetical protein
MHGLQWDYSLIPATTRERFIFKRSLNISLLLITLNMQRFFISMGRSDISELWPPTGLLIPQIIHEYGEPQWSDTDRGKPKN